MKSASSLNYLILVIVALLTSSCAGSPLSELVKSAFHSDAVEEESFLLEGGSLHSKVTVDDMIVESPKDGQEGKGRSRSPSSENREFGYYEVHDRDTLILISYDIYGHHGRWKELRFLNKDKVGREGKIMQGQVLKYRKPEKDFTRPAGRAYLVKKGDTLSVISDNVYGDWKEWPVIWHNNESIIQDPDLIFAGLTIYYPNLEKFKKTKEYYRISQTTDPHELP